MAFIPCGVMGDEIREFSSEQNSALYYDNEHDDKAKRVRDLYFAVANVEVRRRLVRKVLETDDVLDQHCREDAANAKRALWSARQKEDDQPRFTAAVVGVVCVLIGYRVGALVGAIAGAVAGVFFGMSTVSGARRRAKAATEQAAEDAANAEDSLRQLLTRPRFFTPMEAATGERDGSYRVDAFGDRIREFAKANGRG